MAQEYQSRAKEIIEAVKVQFALPGMGSLERNNFWVRGTRSPAKKPAETECWLIRRGVRLHVLLHAESSELSRRAAVRGELS